MFHPRRQEHFIDDGRVYCALRKRDVEFDVCAGCRWRTALDLDAKQPFVRCEPEWSPDWLLRPWL
jgi:hypothetical protein